MSARGRRQLQFDKLSFLHGDTRELYFRGDNDLLEETLISVGYYLRRESGLQCGSCDSLREVHVEGGPVCSDSTARELSNIIENQPSFSRVWLGYENPNVTPSHHRLCNTLSHVLQLTQFTYMHLEGIILLPAGLQQLLHVLVSHDTMPPHTDAVNVMLIEPRPLRVCG